MKILLLLLICQSCYAADDYMIGRTVGCESGGRIWVCGDDGVSCGIAQFQLKTFNWMKHKAKLERLRWREPGDQLKLMEWAFSHGYAHHWTCYRNHHQKWERQRVVWMMEHPEAVKYMRSMK